MKKYIRYNLYAIGKIMSVSCKIFLLVVLGTQVLIASPSAGQSANQIKINMQLENKSLQHVLTVIEKKSGLRFVYNDKLVSNYTKLSISAKKQLVSEILDKVFEGTSLNYLEQDNLVIVVEKEIQEKTKGIETRYDLLKQTVIKGKVTDEKGEPLIGVSVKVKGKQTGTSTNADGQYSISVEDGSSTLVFSYMGYVETEMSIVGRSTVDVVMMSATENLQEVVVVGYGTQKKKEVTSAITSVKAEQFNKGNISDVAQLLQGKVAGLSISRPGGDPNGGFAIRLRGISTLGANTQPLIVLDGQAGADINTVDPNDIKSIDVLKDGSAAAIYGTRGSAGVIIITTKGGKTGTSKFTYNVSGTAEDPARFTQHMTADEFRELGKGTDYEASTDWNKEITRTAMSHVHNLGFSGGDKRTTYDASFNYRNNQGVAITTGFQQLNGRINLTHKALNDKLSFNVNINTSNRNSQFGFAEAFKYATIFNPTAPVYSTDPLYDIAGGGYFETNAVDYSNPVAVLKQNTNGATNKKFNVGGTVTYEILQGLKFATQYYRQSNTNYGSMYSPTNAFISRGFPLGSGFGRNGILAKQNNESVNSQYENTLTYDKKINKFDLSGLAGYSYQDFVNQELRVQGGNFISDYLGEDFGSALDFQNGQGFVDSYKNESKLISFFGRVKVNYNDIAFFSASLRKDGSTQFGVNSQWGYFPAVSAGLDISKLIDIPLVSNLKLRGSYGITGALPPGPYLSLTSLASSGSYYAGNGVYLKTTAGVRNPNPDLKWETKAEMDLGLDFTLLNNRLNGTFDYFSRKTSDLIFNQTVPSPPALYTNTWKNVGEFTNSGVELALSYDAIKKSNFTWTPGGNISSYRVVLTKLTEGSTFLGTSNLGTPGQEATELTRAIVGEPLGILYGPKYLGVDSTGKYQYADADGNPVSSDKAVRQIIGHGLPKFEFGITNNFKYKNVDFSFFMRSSIGHEMINTFRAFYENPTVATSYNVVNTKYFDPTVTDGAAYSSYSVEKADFIKLDNATLGYTFPMGKSGKPSMISSLRAYVSGQNLFTITNYTGVDPEVRYADFGNPLAPGIDRRETWVYTRSFTFGLNLGFN